MNIADINVNYFDLFAGSIKEFFGVLPFFTAFFFFFSLFLGLLSPTVITSNHFLTSVYALTDINAISGDTFGENSVCVNTFLVKFKLSDLGIEPYVKW